MVDVVLLDLDGVIRHFDPGHVARIETAFDLGAGTLTGVAFEPELLNAVITGRLSRREWAERIAAGCGSRRAVDQWLSDRGRIDDAVMTVVEEIRETGRRVAILTNGTDTVPAELQELGIAHRFDAVFNSAEIGYAKPDRRAFEHVCSALKADPRRVFFTDDSPSKLGGAREIGMIAHAYTGVETLRAQLRELQVTGGNPAGA